ncbi:timeless protein-domain-containing protein [Jimgerdemannia flammicorona]|uniref:Timeless protein-domain-containing protein n=1 Tax=Jimgerdemannia flammicorona TaxID=994334 RepID=A0A433QPW8_9FUNG|nr:timeless protein-domain-containing protein [Jimgerdemannia flammicorona]
MDPQYKAYILSVCSALGGFEEFEDENGLLQSVYVMGDECLECLKDIKRCIRLDDNYPEKYILQALGEWQIFQKDLIPILLLNAEGIQATEQRVALACVEIFVPMTWPVEDKDLRDEENSVHAATMVRLLRDYKDAFLAPGVLKAVLSVIANPLAVSQRDRTERDNTIIRLVLTLFRNLVAIKDPKASENLSGENNIRATMQERLLLCYQQADILEFLSIIASNSNLSEFAEWNIIVQEIYYYLFLNVDPGDLFVDVEMASGNRLSEMLIQEESKKKLKSRNASSRHHRFGGTLVLKTNNGQNYNVHKHEAAFADVQNLLDSAKKKDVRGQRRKDQSVFDNPARYAEPEAIQCLKATAQSFLEDCFNRTSVSKSFVSHNLLPSGAELSSSNLDGPPMTSFFSSLRKDFEAERPKIREADYPKFFYLVQFFLRYQRLALERVREERAKQFNVPGTEDEDTDACAFDLVAGAMDARGFLLCVKRMCICKDEKNWSELHVAVDCFKQMLLTLEGMAQSPHEDYREVSESLQNNIFYEESTLDLVVQLIRDYKNQSMGWVAGSFCSVGCSFGNATKFGYARGESFLKSAIELAHVLLKMLERYAKSKRFMFVRKKKAAPKKKKAPGQTDGSAATSDLGEVLAGAEPKEQEQEQEQEQEEEEEEEDPEARRERKAAYAEHVFQLEKFERSFATEVVIKNYCTFLENYVSLSPESIHHIVNMFHRIMVKCKIEAVFFKLSMMELFNRILMDLPTLPKTPAYKELGQFLTFCTRQLFKKLKEYPLLYVEILFPKTREYRRLQDWNGSGSDNDKDFTDMPQKNTNAVAELEVQPDLPWSQKVGVAVAVLIEDQKVELVTWVIEQITFVIAGREAEKVSRAMRMEDAEGDSAMEGGTDAWADKPYDDYAIDPNTEDRRLAMEKNAKFRLLLTLLKFAKEETSYRAQWKIPGTLASDELSEDVKLLHGFIENPLAPNGRPASEMVKKKRRRRERKSRLEAEDEDGVNRKRRKRKEEMTYKSEQFVIDSDDEAGDEEFFRKERELREAMAEKSRLAALEIDKLAQTNISKGKGVKRKRATVLSNDVEGSQGRVSEPLREEEGAASLSVHPRRRRRMIVDEDEDEDEDSGVAAAMGKGGENRTEDEDEPESLQSRMRLLLASRDSDEDDDEDSDDDRSESDRTEESGSDKEDVEEEEVMRSGSVVDSDD